MNLQKTVSLNLETAKSIDWLSKFVSTHLGMYKALMQFFCCFKFIYFNRALYPEHVPLKMEFGIS